MLIPVEKVTLNACSECVDGGNVFIAYAMCLHTRISFCNDFSRTDVVERMVLCGLPNIHV